MTDLLKEAAESYQQTMRDVNNDRNHGLDDGKYEWCAGCKEQVANCRCEAIRIAEERIQAWSWFQDAVWASEGVAEARREVEAMGYSDSDIEGSISRIALWKTMDETQERADWFQDG